MGNIYNLYVPLILAVNVISVLLMLFSVFVIQNVITNAKDNIKWAGVQFDEKSQI